MMILLRMMVYCRIRSSSSCRIRLRISRSRKRMQLGSRKWMGLYRIKDSQLHSIM